jgi:hypothetical protein
LERIERNANRIGAPFGRGRSRTEDAFEYASCVRRLGLRRILPRFAGAFDFGDQLIVFARWFAAAFCHGAQNELYPIDRGQHQSDGFGIRRRAVAEPSEQYFRGMRNFLEPLQIQKPACAFDHMYEAKNIRDDSRVRRLPFETRQLGVDSPELLGALRQEIFQQLVHSAAILPERFQALQDCASPVLRSFEIRERSPRENRSEGQYAVKLRRTPAPPTARRRAPSIAPQS